MSNPTGPERQDLDRRATGSGEDGTYIHNRAPNVDDLDDIDDEDGAAEEELTQENDLTLHVEPEGSDLAGQLADDASLGEEADEVDDLAREDKGAVNIEGEDLRRKRNL
jgi:hypothetical protein